MAGAASLEDILKDLECSICLEIFDDPKELSCPHVFCKTCLDGQIQFNDEGGGRIICALCKEETLIDDCKTTNDLRSALYLKNMADRFSKNQRFPLTQERCGSMACEKRVSIFCTDCRRFFCDSCRREHEYDYPNHNISVVAITKEDTLKVLCEEHNTECDFMCCHNEIVCLYCIKRKHSTHGFKTQDEHIKLLKETLEKEIQRFESLAKDSTDVKQSVETSHQQFKNSLKYRKYTCLYKYISILEKEEKHILEEAQMMKEKHLNDMRNNLSGYALEQCLRLSDTELALLKGDILNTIVQNRCPNVLPICTISLSGYDFLSQKPLGELLASTHDVAHYELENNPNFQFNVPDDDEKDVVAKISKQLQDLVQDARMFINNDKSKTVAAEQDSLHPYIGEDSVKATEVTASIDIAGNSSSNDDGSTIKKPLKRAIPERIETTAVVFGDRRKELNVSDEGRIQDDCILQFKKRGFEYVKELVINNEEERLILLRTELPSDMMSLRGPSEETPIHVAVENNREKILELLISLYFNVNLVDKNGLSVLHYAVRHSAIGCTYILCKDHPHLINMTDYAGETALHYAVWYKEVAQISILCQNRADTSIESKEGVTPLDFAKRLNYRICENTLRPYEPKKQRDVPEFHNIKFHKKEPEKQKPRWWMF